MSSMQGAVFQEDGRYKLVFKLAVDSWPQVKRFSTIDMMLNELRRMNLPFDEVQDFVFRGLQSKGRLLRSLPGTLADWVQFAS